MRLALVTSIWNHYQGALARAFVSLLGPDQFRLCLTAAVDQERRGLGWEYAPPEERWILPPPATAEAWEQMAEEVMAAEVALLGECPHWMMRRRARTGKLTFLSFERFWKRPYFPYRFLDPRMVVAVHRTSRVTRLRNVHYLAIGADAAADVRQAGIFSDRVWTWGYFTDIPDRIPRRPAGEGLRVLWAGRMLSWKCVDVLVRAFARVAPMPQVKQLLLVGAGPEQGRIAALVAELGLGSKCCMQAPVPPAEVRRLMGQADVYVLASNRMEGWGVVANEAMGEGCLLVANEAAGASRMLVQHGRNGLLFRDGDAVGLSQVLGELAGDRERCEDMARAGREQIRCFWSAAVAAERFSTLCEGLAAGRSPVLFEHGPCSVA